MGDEEKLDRSGAFDYDAVLDQTEPPPEEFSNPAGVTRGSCDIDPVQQQDESCEHEVTAQVDDLVAEETKPGYGIPGFEGEESGGG